MRHQEKTLPSQHGTCSFLLYLLFTKITVKTELPSSSAFMGEPLLRLGHKASQKAVILLHMWGVKAESLYDLKKCQIFNVWFETSVIFFILFYSTQYYISKQTTPTVRCEYWAHLKLGCTLQGLWILPSLTIYSDQHAAAFTRPPYDIHCTCCSFPAPQAEAPQIQSFSLSMGATLNSRDET